MLMALQLAQEASSINATQGDSDEIVVDIQEPTDACSEENCLKRRYLAALLGRTPSSKFPLRSLSTVSSSCESISCESISNHDSKTEKRHVRLYPVLFPTVKFCVPKACPLTLGVAVTDILEYDGVCVQDADKPAFTCALAKGTNIDLVVHVSRPPNKAPFALSPMLHLFQWKGYAEEEVYPILIKCACDFDITRGQLAVKIAQAQVSYFSVCLFSPIAPTGEY